MAILWPDSDSDRARHALSQTIYHTRTALQEPELFLAGSELRLNTAVITADLWEFERFLAAGDDKGAVAVYQGPFLDGFNLSGSVEFEEWASSQRRDFASRVSAALERLGTRAESEGDWSAAVQWRQRLAILDITSSRASLKLMEALVKAGDSAAALRHADVHRRAVRALLEAEPDESITAFESNIRSRPQAAPPSERKTPVSLPEVVPVVAVAEPAASSPSVAPRQRLPAAFGSIVAVAMRRSRVVAGVGAAAAVVLAGSLMIPEREEIRGGVVIAPFRVTGADPSLSYLGTGMLDLLAARLHDDSLSLAVDPGKSIRGWRETDIGESGLDRVTGANLARSVGATGVIVGSVVGTPERLYIAASFIGVDSATSSVETRAEGPLDSLSYILDRLAVGLLAARHGESDRLSARRGVSLPAMRAYLSGQLAYRRGEYQAAARQYEVALRVDSQFTLAAFQLAVASDRINDAEQNARAVSIAWNGRDDLSPRDRAQLIALAGPAYPRPSSASGATAALTSVINLGPLRSDMWYEFGERLLRQGRTLAFDDASRRAISAFARALELDPSDRVGARPMLIVAAARMNDTATIARYASPAAIDDSMRTLEPFVRWTVARMRGDRAALSRIRARFSELDVQNLRLIAMSSLYDGVLRDEGSLAADILTRRSVGSRGVDALLAQHAYALAAGDTARALEITERISQRLPGIHAHYRLRVLDAIYGGGNKAAAAEAARRLEVSTSGRHTTELELAVYHADLCVLEQWRLRNGDRSNTVASIRALQASNFPRVSLALSTNPHACAIMLQTWLAVENGEPDAHQRVFALDSLLLDGPAIGDAARYAYILLARLHLRYNDRNAALAALRRRSYLAGWPRYAHAAHATETALLTPSAQVPFGSQ